VYRNGTESGPKRTGKDVGVKASIQREVTAAGSILVLVQFSTIKCKTFTDKNSVYNCVGFYLAHPAQQLQSD
jgi:hypothetical protein